MKRIIVHASKLFLKVLTHTIIISRQVLWTHRTTSFRKFAAEDRVKYKDKGSKY